MTAIAAQMQDIDHGTPTQGRGEPVLHAAGLTPSKKALWGGRTLSGLVTLFLAFDATIKVLELPVAVEGTAKLGYPTTVIFALGIVQILCLIAYLVPRTAVLGAILWTGYLGGAIATHVRVGDPLFSHILFPTYVAGFIWAGLWLREPRLRALVPLRSAK